ncbi:MAG: DNA repair protein RecO [Rhizobiales bacterium 65-9]|nr:DNA repair protein RecO [Hyphomicrobiales bacterium]OJY33970.1 MAG: DNA repair protein RecO [Rhizobiales bacterium 65-9]
MEWTDDAIVIGVRRHGESSVILEAMTPARGRHAGLVRGGRSAKMQPILQPGNSVRLIWRARLEDHLGNYLVEPLTLRAGRLIDNGPALAALVHLGALARLLPERDPHPPLYEALRAILDRLDDLRLSAALIARFELALLAELGFGLDLSECAASGARADLVYVSPKSGRAVSREAGRPYGDRLLPLPAFLQDEASAQPQAADLADAFRLTLHFLNRLVFEPRGLAPPEARERFVRAAAAL